MAQEPSDEPALTASGHPAHSTPWGGARGSITPKATAPEPPGHMVPWYSGSGREGDWPEGPGTARAHLAEASTRSCELALG